MRGTGEAIVWCDDLWNARNPCRVWFVAPGEIDARLSGLEEMTKSVELRLEVGAVHTLRIEATAVARLYGKDPTAVVGWLYVWNTEELGIRCTDKTMVFRFIDPPIDLNRYSRRFRANKRVWVLLASTRPLPSQTP